MSLGLKGLRGFCGDVTSREINNTKQILFLLPKLMFRPCCKRISMHKKSSLINSLIVMFPFIQCS